MTEEKKETNNLDLWNQIEKTPLEFTSKVDFGRKFTAIDAYYRIKKATELWGPFGMYWGVVDETFEIIPAYNLLVYRGTMYYPMVISVDGVGAGRGCIPMANAIELKNSKGHVDDEAWKKIKTDSLTKALSMVGMCSDVFLGKFEDDRYINALKKEGAANNMPPNQSPKRQEIPQNQSQNRSQVPNHSTPQQNPATPEKMASAVVELKRIMTEKLGSDENALLEVLKKISSYQNKDGKIVSASSFEKLSEKWAANLILEFKKYMFEKKIIDWFAGHNGGDRSQADLEYGNWLECNTRMEGHDKGLEYIKQVTSEKWLNVIKGKWDKFTKEQAEVEKQFAARNSIDTEENDKWIPDEEKDFDDGIGG